MEIDEGNPEAMADADAKPIVRDFAYLEMLKDYWIEFCL